MPKIQSVVCPVDRSDISKRALQVAVSLAATHHANLHIVEVLDTAFPPLADSSAVLQVQDGARIALEEDLNWFAAPLLRNDVTTEVHLREGRVVAEILRMAGEFESPLIVMGTHGRSGFERFVLGSVTEKIVRKAHCPVLVVPPAKSADQALLIRRVVCAVDFSPASVAALTYALQIAEAASANISLLHILEWPFGEGTGPEPIAHLRANLEAEAKSDLEHMVGATNARVAERVVKVGKPGIDIAAFARERAADVVVLGASGKGAVNQAVLGSTAHAVLRDAPCLVLTVPAAVRRV